MIELYLIRHAESEYNVEDKRIGGTSNFINLTEKGREQARLLGQRLKKENLWFDKVYSSCAIRAKDTAFISLAQTGFDLSKIVLSDQIVERNRGAWQGKLKSEILTTKVLQDMRTNPYDHTSPDGESQRQAEARMHKFFKEQIMPFYSENPKIALYTHGFATKCFLRGVLGSDPSMTYKIAIDNTAITQLRMGEEGWEVLKLNDTAHLK